MGEIADALRRARGQSALRSQPRPEAPLPPAPERAAPEADLGPLPATPDKPPAETIESLHPADAAIALEEGAEVEACRQVALRLRAALDANEARSVAVVSAVRDEGKTSTLCNVGIALASMSRGRDVALVDLDLRRPSLARVLDVRAGAGVEDVLKGRASLDEARVSVRRPAIDLYVTSSAQQSAHELLVLPTFARMIDELERRYTTVLIDTPPALLVPDTNLILRRVSFCIPVARAGRTRAREFQRLVELLPRQQLLGVLLNGGRGTERYYEAYKDEEETEPQDLDRGRRGWFRGEKPK